MDESVRHDRGRLESNEAHGPATASTRISDSIRSDAVPLVAAALVALAAWQHSLANYTLAGDDWFAILPGSTDLYYVMGSGRWANALVWAFLARGQFDPTFTLLLSLAVLLATGWVAARTWRLRGFWPVFAAAALVTTSPLLTDPLGFKQYQPSYPLAMLAASLAVWLPAVASPLPRLIRSMGSVALLVFSLATYQAAALTFIVVLLGREIRLLVAEEPDWASRLRDWMRYAAIGATATVCYVATVYVSWAITPYGPHVGSHYDITSGYIGASNLVPQLLTIARVAPRFYTKATVFFPAALKVIFLALTALALFGAAHRLWDREPTRGRRATQILYLLALAAGLLLVPFAAILVRPGLVAHFLRYNMISAVVLTLAFLGSTATIDSSGASRSRRLAPYAARTLLVCSLLVSCFQVNLAFFALQMLNQKDLAIANRMLSRLEAYPQFPKVGEEVTVLTAGRLDPVYGKPFKVSRPSSRPRWFSVAACDVLSCQPSRLPNVLQQLDPFRNYVATDILDPTNPVEPYRSDLASMPVWPALGSIKYVDGVFLVKLSDPWRSK